MFASDRAQFFPTVDSLSTSKAVALESHFAAAVVACLISSKSETRSSADLLLDKCLHYGTLSLSSVKGSTKKLLPAQQRTVQRNIDALDLKYGSLNAADERARSLDRKQRKQERSMSRHRNGRSSLATASPARRSLSGSSAMTRKQESTPSRVPFSRRSISSKKISESNDLSNDEDDTDISINPLQLIDGVSSTKDQRCSAASRKKEVWPEYPEEPSSPAVLNLIKTCWSSLISIPSIKILFPLKSIQRQEDSVKGCELLARAITFSREGDGNKVIDLLDLVLKWLSSVVHARESTVGMQSIISLLMNLLSFLNEKSYQMNDFEAGVILPYIMEKSGAAKV